jgi:hypothetical protein
VPAALGGRRGTLACVSGGPRVVGARVAAIGCYWPQRTRCTRHHSPVPPPPPPPPAARPGGLSHLLTDSERCGAPVAPVLDIVAVAALEVAAALTGAGGARLLRYAEPPLLAASDAGGMRLRGDGALTFDARARVFGDVGGDCAELLSNSVASATSPLASRAARWMAASDFSGNSDARCSTVAASALVVARELRMQIRTRQRRCVSKRLLISSVLDWQRRRLSFHSGVKERR